ncbi:type II toxin-antitoxin system RelE/ParE family toxin [Cyclonatronum proteinivorum]|uniref:type II toxin-antitoxin system RelE/ParE family toxin n=1 Tax=Cyclonatronum proteinivorum TaxID=1457365 RepID=UPI002FD31B86
MTNRLKNYQRYIPLSKKTFSRLIESLTANPETGISIGNGFYKIRMAITSKGKGKSAGARVITFVKITDSSVFLTSVYDKSDKVTISEKEIEKIVAQLPGCES